MGKNIIEVINVTKKFKETVALDNVSVQFESGKIYGIVGHNGSGKTVLFKCICGYLNYDSGEIKINGKVMGSQINMLSDAGVIIEEPAFLKNWNAYRNLDFLYTIRNKKTRSIFMQFWKKSVLTPK